MFQKIKNRREQRKLRERRIAEALQIISDFKHLCELAENSFFDVYSIELGWFRYKDLTIHSFTNYTGPSSSVGASDVIVYPLSGCQKIYNKFNIKLWYDIIDEIYPVLLEIKNTVISDEVYIAKALRGEELTVNQKRRVVDNVLLQQQPLFSALVNSGYLKKSESLISVDVQKFSLPSHNFIVRYVQGCFSQFPQIDLLDATSTLCSFSYHAYYDYLAFTDSFIQAFYPEILLMLKEKERLHLAITVEEKKAAAEIRLQQIASYSSHNTSN